MRVRKYNKVWMLATMLLVAACADSNDLVPKEQEEAHITFAHMTTRTPLQDLPCLNFLVKTFKRRPDNTAELVMDNYTVNYTDEAWNYEDVEDQYLKYWDLSAKDYTFAAIAPAPQARDKFSIGNDGKIRLEDIDDGTEWMIARTIRTQDALNDKDDIENADIDPQPEAFTDVVPLIFHHLTAQVEFRIYSEGGDQILTTLKIDIKDIHRKGTFAEEEDSPWTMTDTAETLPIYNSGLTVNTYTKETAQRVCQPTSVMPQDLTGVNIVVNIPELGIDVPLALSDEWEMGTKYIYYLKLSVANDEIILVDVEPEDWHKGDDITIEDPVTNW